MDSKTPAATSASLLDTLKRLTSAGSPLQATIAELRAVLRNAGIVLGPESEERFRQVERDLASVQVGSKRMANQIDQLQGLVRTSAMMTSTLDMDRVLEEVIDTAILLTRAERAFLALASDDGAELDLRAVRNWDKETLRAEEVTFSRSIIDNVLRSGESVLTINAQGDARFQGKESVLVNDLRSILCIPLKLGERIIGVLYADNRFVDGVFDQESVELLSTFGNQAAIAIVNAQSFSRMKADLAEAKREVERLQIEVNEQRLKAEVSEITETEYFQRLSSLAKEMRTRKSEA